MLAGKRPNQVLVDVGGVGYLVQVPLSTFAALGELHTEVTLLIHTHVREDALAVIGIVEEQEQVAQANQDVGAISRADTPSASAARATSGDTGPHARPASW